MSACPAPTSPHGRLEACRGRRARGPVRTPPFRVPPRMSRARSRARRRRDIRSGAEVFVAQAVVGITWPVRPARTSSRTAVSKRCAWSASRTTSTTCLVQCRRVPEVGHLPRLGSRQAVEDVGRGPLVAKRPAVGAAPADGREQVLVLGCDLSGDVPAWASDPQFSQQFRVRNMWKERTTGSRP